ncbi:hypothetical protein [Patulibacter minatonensis]|uniref:hypothetical protein n=1 Tax=Patulibacter minatonensis TaxID=298163 RepID=UPI00047B64C1|nr:hypothetical protein [Patulibacter minatonensis]
MPIARSTLVASVAVGLVATAVPATAAAAGGASARAAAPDACGQRLAPARQSVYRFKAGTRTLTAAARVTVTPTKANRHRYCVRVLTAGRTVLQAWGETGYVRRNGAWVRSGGLGDSFTAAGYTQTIQVPKAHRIDRVYRIRSGGRWYSTSVVSRSRA